MTILLVFVFALMYGIIGAGIGTHYAKKAYQNRVSQEWSENEVRDDVTSTFVTFSFVWPAVILFVILRKTAQISEDYVFDFIERQVKGEDQ